MTIKIKVNEDGLHHIVDDTLEENGWIIVEMKDHTWELYENVEWFILNPDKKPFKVYANHELGDAIKQGQLWT